MRAMASDEAKAWCEKRSISVSDNRFLRYGGSKLCFTLGLPEKPSRLVALAAWLLQRSDETPFQGALLWIRQWGIWSKGSEEAGMKIMEALRQAHGEMKPLKDAPAMLFGPEELRDLHAFFIQPLLFGWDAFMVPVSGEYFSFTSHDELICVVAKTEECLRGLMKWLRDWAPQKDDPYYFRG
jgi:hypothetical protein